jgi:hypothetical protein
MGCAIGSVLLGVAFAGLLYLLAARSQATAVRNRQEAKSRTSSVCGKEK